MDFFESPRTADGHLATINNCSSSRLIALHRCCSLARARRTSSSASVSRRIFVDVELRRLPRGEEPRHFYMSLWSQVGEDFVPLTEERLVAAPRDDSVFLHHGWSNPQRQRKSSLSRSPSPRPAAFVMSSVSYDRSRLSGTISSRLLSRRKRRHSACRSRASHYRRK